MDEKLKFELVLSATGVQFTNSVGKALKGVSAFQKEMRGARKAADSLDAGLASMAGKLSALVGGISLGVLSKSIWDASVKLESLNNGFKAIFGSAALAEQEMNFVRQTADSLGLVLDQTADAYKNISAAAKGTVLAGGPLRDIFTAIAETSTALHMSADDTTGALRAISQMISKGNVQAEELRGQLGERLPGAFQLAAESMGVTTQELNKMLEKGEVLATDMLPKLARVLHDKYGKAAEEASNSAQASLNRLNTAWFDLQNTIGKAGFMDLATGKINDLATAMNNPAVKERITELAESFFEMADAVLEFTMNYAKMLGKVALGAIALSATSRTIFALTGIWNGLNAAMLVTTGMRLVPYLASVTTSLRAVNLAAMGTATAMGAAAGATLALIGGYKAGEWLTMHKHWSAIEDQTKANAVANKELAQRYREVSKATGVTITSMKQLDQAVKDGKIHYDEVVGAWVAGSKKITTAVEQSAEKQEEVTKEALEAMKQEYQKYTDEIARLQDKIANKEQSLAERLRSMSRSGMSDFSAWKDRKKEAMEYEDAAVKAANAGDFEGAIQLAGKAEDAYASLNKEVKDGEQILLFKDDAMKAAMAGVRSAGELTIEILEKQKNAAEKAREALDKESGGTLSRSLEDAKNGVDNISKASVDMGDTMVDQINRFGVAAAEEFDLIERYLNSPHKMVIEIEKIEKNKIGGMIGGVQRFNTGGFPRRPSGQLAGYGGGDKIRALLEAGEFIVRKEAVSKYGAAFFHALNSMRVNNLPPIQARIGGLIDSAGQASIQKFQSGGMAVATPKPAGETVTVNFNFPGPEPAIPAKMTPLAYGELERQARRQKRLSSR